jgi:hypothetical protein
MDPLREGRMFSFEKKNQKTFVSAPAEGLTLYTPERNCIKSQSFLVLFFKKEHSFFA